MPAGRKQSNDEKLRNLETMINKNISLNQSASIGNFHQNQSN